ncbi:hypothetical protein HET69_38975 [Streptomyces sp. CJ_13]|uniref:hypothetical protein n=1 Tax=Streptomyces sp. CJ_13 TaxID=2724943 RepID=UPI001BDBDEDD|nr:hypothetical protein [Streptomyces sp. CJ_13]MBT1189807.1 hypothetical protein [Streptomyces sp. CJ_13]
MTTAKSYPEHGGGLWLGRTSTAPLPLRRRLLGLYWAAGGRLLYNAGISVRDVARGLRRR